MNASITAQHKHEPTMRVVRVNGQITEVKYITKTKVNSKMGDHLGSMYFVFFSTLAIISRITRQIIQILPLSWNFGKTQISVHEDRQDRLAFWWHTQG